MRPTCAAWATAPSAASPAAAAAAAPAAARDGQAPSTPPRSPFDTHLPPSARRRSGQEPLPPAPGPAPWRPLPLPALGPALIGAVRHLARLRLARVAAAHGLGGTEAGARVRGGHGRRRCCCGALSGEAGRYPPLPVARQVPGGGGPRAAFEMPGLAGTGDAPRARPASPLSVSPLPGLAPGPWEG